MPVYVPDANGELTALAQTAIDIGETTSQLPAGDLGAAFVKMFLSLIILVILLGTSYWFLRRLIQKKLEKGVGNATIQIVEKKMISAKTMLYLVEVEGKRILLAESHLEIKRLAELGAQPSEYSDR